MSGCCSMVPRCPSCREPLAPKNLEATCGSCGHKFCLPIGRPPGPIVLCSVGCLLAIVLLLLVLLENANAKRANERRGLEASQVEKARLFGQQRSLLSKQETLEAANHELGQRISRLQAELLRAEGQRLGAETPPPASTSAPPPRPGDVKSDLEQAELKADINFLEDVAARDPGNPEVHFRLSMAYDRLQSDPNWSAKSFEHAKKAIKLDPNYKKKFQPMIRNSQVAKKVAAIIHEIIQKSEDSQIPDEEAAKYAEEIGKILGDRNIKSETLEPGQNGSESQLKEMIKDPAKRQRLRQLFNRSTPPAEESGPVPDPR